MATRQSSMTDAAWLRQSATARWVQGVADTYLRPVNPMDYDKQMGRAEFESMRKIAREAPTYALAPDIAQFIGQSAPTIARSTVLHQSDLHEPMGFVWCEEPLNMPMFDELHPDTGEIVYVPIQGFAWHTIRNKMRDGTIADGVFMLFLVSAERYAETHYAVHGEFVPVRGPHAFWGFSLFMRFEDSLDMMQTRAREFYELAGPDKWAFTTDDDAIDRMRYVLAFWNFLRIKLLVTPAGHLSRHVHRQRARAYTHAPEVFVVELRRKTPIGVEPRRRDDDSEREPIDWQFRWPVSGHWRNQPYPSRGTSELIWIEGYVKGPDDKPLRVSPHVLYKVVR